MLRGIKDFVNYESSRYSEVIGSNHLTGENSSRRVLRGDREEEGWSLGCYQAKEYGLNVL